MAFRNEYGGVACLQGLFDSSTEFEALPEPVSEEKQIIDEDDIDFGDVDFDPEEFEEPAEDEEMKVEEKPASPPKKEPEF